MACYQTATRVVKKGNVTWDELISMGLAQEGKPSGSKGTPSLFTVALKKKIQEVTKKSMEASQPEPSSPDPETAEDAKQVVRENHGHMIDDILQAGNTELLQGVPPESVSGHPDNWSGSSVHLCREAQAKSIPVTIPIPSAYPSPDKVDEDWRKGIEVED